MLGTMGKNALLVYNPAAGRFALSKRHLEKLVGELEGVGLAPELEVTLPPDRSERVQRLKEKDLQRDCKPEVHSYPLFPAFTASERA